MEKPVHPQMKENKGNFFFCLLCFAYFGITPGGAQGLLEVSRPYETLEIKPY